MHVIMGHATDNDMSGQYRERSVADQRLQRVVDHVARLAVRRAGRCLRIFQGVRKAVGEVCRLWQDADELFDELIFLDALPNQGPVEQILGAASTQNTGSCLRARSAVTSCM